MNSSTETGEVLKALQAALGELPNPQNDAKNPHFKSKYVKLDALLSWLKPHLAAHGVRLSQPPVTRDGWVGCVTRFTHGDSGQWIEEGEFLVPFKGDDPQKAMSALTYSRRGALCAAIAVCGTDEDDDGNYASSPPKPTTPAGPTEAQANTAAALRDYMEDAADMKQLGTVWADTVKAFNENKITSGQMDKLVALKDKLKKGFGA